MKELFKEIDEQITDFVKNAEEQLTKGNKQAGLRARKASMKLTELFKNFRKESVKFTKEDNND